MELVWVAIAVIIFLYVFYLAKFKYFETKERTKIKNHEILKVLLNLDGDSLEELFKFYKDSFGKGAAYYARRTHKKWKTGQVQPNSQTFERFMLHLPKVLNFELKCEILRLLMNEFAPKEQQKLSIYIDDWETTLEPLVKIMIEKPYYTELPKQIQKKLTWLSEGEMQTAQEILKKSQIEEGKIAVSTLRKEFEIIENILSHEKLKPKVTHQLKFPFGTITLNIKRR